MKIISAKSKGVKQTYSLTMEADQHNYILENGIVSKNSHSISYAFITYWTAYLKTHYPREYMASLCTHMSDLDETAKYLQEVRRMGLKVYTPDINKSHMGYTLEDDGIRIGFGTLRNVGEGPAKTLMELRSQKKFDSLYDIAFRANPRSPVFKSLAFCGALDQWGTRLGISATVEEILKKARKNAKQKDQISLFTDEEVISFDIPDQEFSFRELLKKEKEVMGIYVSGHPLDDYANLMTGSTVADLKDTQKDDSTKLLVLVNDVETKYTRNQQVMANVTIEDQTGEQSIVVFPKSYESYGHLLIPGNIIKVSLRSGWDDFRDQPNYVVSFIDEVKQEKEIDTSKVFGIYVPKGFMSDSTYMGKLKGILLGNIGKIPVDIYISRSTILNTEHKFLVDGSQKMKEEIKELFQSFQGGEKVG